MTDSFSVNGALFPQTAEDLKARMKGKYDPSKANSYPTAEGIINIPAGQAYALAEYIMQGKPIGERNEIPLAISGWKKQSASGRTYISLAFKPHYKYEKNTEGAVNDAAQSVAKATDGNIIDDIF
jgi:Rieske Fe-S protein